MSKTFGQYLRFVREASGVSLRKLASDAGVSPTYLSLVERDKADPPTTAKLELMAAAMGCDRDEMVFSAGRLPSDVEAAISAFPRKVAQVLRYTGVTTMKKGGI